MQNTHDRKFPNTILACTLQRNRRKGKGRERKGRGREEEGDRMTYVSLLSVEDEVLSNMLREKSQHEQSVHLLYFLLLLFLSTTLWNIQCQCDSVIIALMEHTFCFQRNELLYTKSFYKRQENDTTVQHSGNVHVQLQCIALQLIAMS